MNYSPCVRLYSKHTHIRLGVLHCALTLNRGVSHNMCRRERSENSERGIRESTDACFDCNDFLHITYSYICYVCMERFLTIHKFEDLNNVQVSEVTNFNAIVYRNTTVKIRTKSLEFGS